MRLSLIFAAGALAMGTVAAVPADAQRGHGGGHGGHGGGHGGGHAFHGGGHGFRGGGHGGFRGGGGYRRWHGGYHGRLVCRYRHGFRRCFRVF